VALRQAENDVGRLKLVGIRMEDDTRPARDGALIVDSKVRGYVATMRKSFTTGEASAWPWWNPSWPTKAPGWRFSKMNATG
jgi:hypothetical protein